MKLGTKILITLRAAERWETAAGIISASGPEGEVRRASEKVGLSG
jgi:hypothetical protein